MKKLLFFVAGILCAAEMYAQNITWNRTNESNLSPRVWQGKEKPKVYQLFNLDKGMMQGALRNAVSEQFSTARLSSTHIMLPDASGQLQEFSVVVAPVAEPALLQKFPGNQSYYGRSVSDPNTVVRFSYTLNGLNAIIYTPGQPQLYIRSLDPANNVHIVVSEENMKEDVFECTTTSLSGLRTNIGPRSSTLLALNANDGNIYTFRLALAASAEFSDKYDNDPENDDGDANRKAAVIAYQMTHLTFANFYLERDFGVRLIMIGNNDDLIYLDPTTDPWNSDDDDGEYNNSTQVAIDAVIGSDNYDIGHLMRQSVDGASKGNAGGIGSICNNGSKGSGFTTRGNWDAVDTYTEMMFTHELGHQCGANHTFTHQDDNDNAQMEPGSGSTIMSYGGNGIAPASQAFVPYRDKYFHAISIQQATTYVSGVSCGTTVAANNTAPTANAGGDFTIPKSTPFVLTGTASDNENDPLIYTWEQMDKLTAAGDFPRIPSSTDVNGPEFRSRPPSSSPSRTMPMDGIANDWEVLPSVERTLNFRFTVRDDHGSGAQNNSDDMVVTIGDAGPFAVTAPNGGEQWCPGNHDITWLVNGSDAMAANVKITLSTDGGITYPTVIVASTPNDGSYTYNFPCDYSNTARIKIEAVGNIFFDMSDNDFTNGDNTNPEFTVPDDITIYKDDNCAFDAAPSITGEPTGVTDNCDASPTVTYTNNESPGSCVGETILTRTWKVTDDCGKFTEKDQVITIKDTTRPSFTVPAEAVIYKDENCDYDADPSITGSPTGVHDNCDTDPDVTYSDVVVPGTCMGEEIITRTWKVTDDCGNFATDIQVITAKDSSAPVLSNISASPNILWSPNHKMREVIISYDVMDNCSDFDHITTSLSIESNEPINGTGDGDTEPIDYEVIDNHTVMLRAERAGNGSGRIYTITITAVDDCGNQSQAIAEVAVPHNMVAPMVSTVVDAKEERLQISLVATPNPSHHAFTINVAAEAEAGPVRLRAVNAAGIAISQQQVNATSTIQWGQEWRPGLYIIEAVQGKHRTMIKVLKW